MHGDVIPVGELLGDAAIARKIVLLEIVECRIREHHAEAEGVVGPIALVHRDVGGRALLLQQDRRIKTRRSATDDRDFHGSLANSPGHGNYFKPKIIWRKSSLLAWTPSRRSV
ncbi:hypothetical protein ACVJGB_008112 [Bradyrhizobium liaoningense]